MLGGCDKSKTSPSPTSTVAGTQTTATPVPTAATNHTQKELSMDAYEKFMKNEAKLSFDLYMPKDDMKKDLFKNGNDYSLSEVLAIVTADKAERFKNKKINNIDYSYIDCGKDGVNELALRFNGMDIYAPNDNSTLVYIIKYIDGKLSLCYSYETWARSESTLNEYGYYRSSGSNGASNHSSSSGLIDKDGNWQFIESTEMETNINQLSGSKELEQIPKVAQTKGITGGIELDTIRFNESADNKEHIYTFYVFDSNNKPVKDANLYTSSVYKQIFDEAKVPFKTPDEVSSLISEKEKKVGATAEIKGGAEVTWKVLSNNLFLDYVGK